uniref:NADH-ubiquinone oxidoreductase chain 2 n=1 Tax=Pleurocryptella fimbriata TaxID=2480055 RepID=A0A8K1Y3J5_9CRUS|nr:NADH dehydrogenase subunit 2 [Pleurocryptella fimbriata]
MFKVWFMFLLTSVMILGVILSITSFSWFSAWIGLELNTLSFIPFLALGSSNKIESGMKYFLVQSCSSFVMLQGAMMINMGEKMAMLVILSSLVLKVGGSPFHQWFPLVMVGLDWLSGMLLMTLQKLAPLTLIFYMYTPFFKWGFTVLALSSGFIGMMGGLNELLISKLLSFSSINHLGWVIYSMTFEGGLWVIYFFSYCLMIMSILCCLHILDVYHLNQMMMKKSGYNQVHLFLLLMSLGGMPPLFGFLPKWMVVNCLSSVSDLAIMTLFLSMSVVTLFFYTRLGLSSLTFHFDSFIKSDSTKSIGKVGWVFSLNMGLTFAWGLGLMLSFLH